MASYEFKLDSFSMGLSVVICMRNLILGTEYWIRVKIHIGKLACA